MSVVISSKLFGLVFLFMDCYLFVQSQDSFCLTHVTCNKPGVNFVAPCVRHIDGKKAYCDTTALSSYYSYSKCTPTNCDVEEKDYCKNNLCNNNGECHTMFGSYSCSCQNNFHGRNCAEKSESEIRTVQGVYVMINKVTTIRKRTLIYIFISKPGDDMSILISTGDSGEVIKINKAQMSTVNGKNKCTQLKLKEYHCRHLPVGEMFYRSIYFEVIYTLEGSVMEYYPKENIPVPGFKINTISVKVFNRNSEEYSDVFPQVVSYRNEICPIQVTITENCGSRSNKPLQLRRKEDRVIRSILKKSPLSESECPNQIVDFKWNIFEIGTKLWTPLLLPDKSAGGFPEYDIEKFTWPIGLYKVKLTVFLSGIKHTEEYSTSYSGICFFEIVKTPLKIKIQGDTLRTVSQYESFALNASQSYDPNEPRNHQSHLEWTWTCNSTEEFCEPQTFNHGILLFPNGLHKGVWKFTLTLKTRDRSNAPVSASQTVISSEFLQVQLDINCLKNCGTTDFKTNPKEIVYLEAVVLNSFKVQAFQWLFSVDGDPRQHNVRDISETSIKSNILIIKKNALNIGSAYTFTVRPAETGLSGSSSITIITSRPPDRGVCNISPQVGQVGTTHFSIYCVNFSIPGNEITQFSYEFYQKAPQQEHPGTMIGYSTSGLLKNVMLTQNNITVRIISVYGMYIDISLIVRLKQWQPTIQNIKHLLNTLTSTRLAGDSGSSVRTAGVVIDVMKNVADKLNIVKTVLENLRKGKITDFSDVKLFTSVLKKVVTIGIQQLENGIDGPTVQSLGAIMESLAKSMLHNVMRTDKTQSLIIGDDIKNIILTMLECSDTIVNSKDKSLFDPSSSNRAMFISHDQYKLGTASMVTALHLSGVAILTSLLPHEQEILLKAEDSIMWLKVENAEVLANLSEIPQNYSTNIKLNKQLGTLISGRSENVAMKVTLFNKNLYWWDSKETNIGSKIISVNVWERSRNNKLITKVSEPLDIFFNLKNITFERISGSVKMPGLLDNDDEKDISVAVHILEAPPENSNGKLFVEFIDLKNTELRVLISENLRPDYNLIMSKNQVISSNFSRLSLSYQNISAHTLHYVGILPGANTFENQTVSYTFKTYSVQCKLRHLTVWTSPACKIGEETLGNTVHCKCSHMSVFGSGIFVAPHTVHPIKDLYLLMTVKDNPLVFTITISLLLLYLILLIWSKIKEQRDTLHRKVIVLEDNFPGELHSYLVVVFTAFSIGSGTTSNVGIRLIGSNGPSRAHILRSKTRKVLRRNSDDWFLLFTQKHLGDLEAIHIWHDNSGSDWCCRKIHVYDMKTEKQYIFMVEQWLSVRPREFPEAVIKSLGPNHHYNWKKTVIHNFVYHLQENHIWASIFICHPRATVSKSQRLTITFCIIFISFLTGIMFYGVARGQVKEDEPMYTIKFREIFVAIQSIAISAVLTSVIIVCFRKSNSVVQFKGENTNTYRLTKVTDHISESKTKANQRSEYVLLKFMRRAIYIIVRGKPLMPILVGLESYESVVRRRQWAIAGWLASQTTIWLSAFFIILYGLKLGKVISKLWITSAVLSFAQGAFINAPLKIIAFSTILAMFGEMYKVDTYECDIAAAMRRQYFGDEDFLSNLMVMRSSSEYRPLPISRVNEFRNLHLKHSNLCNKLEFCITIIFLLLLMKFTGDLWAGNNFYINSHISIILTRSLRSHEPSLEEVNNITDLISFLITNWIPNLFKGKWYNRRADVTSTNESLPHTGWFTDVTHRLVGLPRIRQIRIRHKYCPSLCFNGVNLTTYCFPALTHGTLDTDTYGLEWGPVNNYINKPLLMPWSYQWETDGSTTYGKSSVAYPDGGYIVMLQDTQRACASTISDLRDLNWWDIRLRALISGVSLYNPNTNTLSALSIVSEHLPSSAFTNQIQTFTVHMEYHYLHPLVFLCVLGCYNVLLFNAVNRQGIFETLSDFWGCYFLILVLLSDICFIVYWLKILKSTQALHTFQQSDSNGYFQFSEIKFYYKLAEVLWAFLICLAPIKILHFEFVINLCYTSCYTIFRSKLLLTVVSVVVIILITVQILVLNFAICLGQKPVYKSKYNMIESVTLYDNSYKYNSIICSQMVAVTCSSAILMFQIILIQTYTDTKCLSVNKRAK